MISKPAVSPDGATVYVTSKDGNLYAINAGVTGRVCRFSPPRDQWVLGDAGSTCDATCAALSVDTSWQQSLAQANANGNRLPTKEEAAHYCSNVGPVRTGDTWIPVGTNDADKDYVWCGTDRSYHYLGKSHQDMSGWPAWADSCGDTHCSMYCEVIGNDQSEASFHQLQSSFVNLARSCGLTSQEPCPATQSSVTAYVSHVRIHPRTDYNYGYIRLDNFEIRVGDHDGVSSNVACAHGLSNTDGAIRDYGCHAHGRYVFIAFHTSDGFANVEEFEVMGVHGNHQLQASTPSFLQCTDLGLFCDSRAQTDLDTHAKMNSAMQSLGLSCDPNNDSGRGYAGAPTADSPSGTQYQCLHFEAYAYLSESYNHGGGTSSCSNNIASHVRPFCRCAPLKLTSILLQR